MNTSIAVFQPHRGWHYSRDFFEVSNVLLCSLRGLHAWACWITLGHLERTIPCTETRPPILIFPSTTFFSLSTGGVQYETNEVHVFDFVDGDRGVWPKVKVGPLKLMFYLPRASEFLNSHCCYTCKLAPRADKFSGLRYFYKLVCDVWKPLMMSRHNKIGEHGIIQWTRQLRFSWSFPPKFTKWPRSLLFQERVSISICFLSHTSAIPASNAHSKESPP